MDDDETKGNTKTCLILDGMAVVIYLISVKSFKTCIELGEGYNDFIQAKARHFGEARMVFDNYAHKKLTKGNNT